MTHIFSNVVAHIDNDLKGKFLDDFDYVAMVTKVSFDAGVQVKTTENGDSRDISLHGLWVAMEQVHSLLTSALTVYGATTPVSTEKMVPQEKADKFTIPQRQSPVEADYLIDKYLNKANNIETAHTYVKTTDRVLGIYNEDNECLDSSIHEPVKKHSAIDSVTKSHVTNNIKHESIFGAQVDDVINSANVGSGEIMICEDRIIGKVKLEVENRTAASVKRKQGRPRKQFKGTSDQKKDLRSVPTFQKFRKKYQLLKRQIHGDGSSASKMSCHGDGSKMSCNGDGSKMSCHGDGNKLCPRGRGRPRSFPEGKPGEHFCHECDFVAKTRSSLSDHCHRLHFGRPTQCDVCHKIFPNRRYMKRHRASHVEPQHCCDVCGKMYKIRKAMLEHKKTHEEGYARPSFPCDVCSKSFCSHYILSCHVKSEHLGQKRNFLCSVCGKRFTTKHSLQEHSNAHTGAKPHICEVCGKGFSYESALRDHKFVHINDKQFVCEICSKAFSQRSGLKMHTRIHKPVKQFVCGDCGREFTQKQALQRHERVHKGDRPFTCKLCSRNFSDASIIRRHMILVHKIHKDAKTWREDIICKVKGAVNYHVERIAGVDGTREHDCQISVHVEVNTSEEKNEEASLHSPATEASAEGKSTSRPDAGGAEAGGETEGIPSDELESQSARYLESRCVHTPTAMQTWYPGLQHEKHYGFQKPDFSQGSSVSAIGTQPMDKTLVCHSEFVHHTDAASESCIERVTSTDSSQETKATHERLYICRNFADPLQVGHPLPGVSCDQEHPLTFPEEQRSLVGQLLETADGGRLSPQIPEATTETYSEDLSQHRERTAQYISEYSGRTERPQYSSAPAAQSEPSVLTNSSSVPASSQAWPMYAYYSHLASQFGMTLGDYPNMQSSGNSHQ